MLTLNAGLNCVQVLTSRATDPVVNKSSPGHRNTMSMRYSRQTHFSVPERKRDGAYKRVSMAVLLAPLGYRKHGGRRTTYLA